MSDENTELISAQERLTVLSTQLSRALLGTALGESHGGERDIYEVLGYPSTLAYKQYKNRYDRGDIAKRIIDAPVNATWRGQPKITENQEKPTDFDEAWSALSKRIQLWTIFGRVDKLTGLGRYGCILLGFDDIESNDGFKDEVSKGTDRQLLYAQPYSENSCVIKQWDNDPTSDRYGMPLQYELTPNPDDGNNSSTGSTKVSSGNLVVHHSRVIHVADGLLENQIYGTPRLKAVFNRLQDLEKVVGGSAEMFWKGARPGYQAVIDSDASLSAQAKADIKDQFDEYEHNLRRILRLQGVEMKGLAPQVSDPTAHVDSQLKLISATTAIPVRILTGSERGELASSQDERNWKESIVERREDFAEPVVLTPFIDRCIEYGVLPEPKDDYAVEWPDQFALSQKDKAEIGKLKAETLSKYASSPGADMLLPPTAFFEYLLDMDPAQINRIEEMQESMEEIPEDEENMDDEEV